MSDELAGQAQACEHFWISKHQPDFPRELYWVRQCSMCNQIDAADLAEQVGIFRLHMEAWARGQIAQEMEAIRLSHVFTSNYQYGLGWGTAMLDVVRAIRHPDSARNNPGWLVG